VGALDRWLALDSTEQRLTAAAAIVLGASVVRVRLLGVKRTLAWANAPLGRAGDDAVDAVARAVARAARYCPGASCLPRSMALTRMLRKKGVPANVRIGVVTDPAFAAHAWVEVTARPVGEPPSPFTPLPLP
jgi:hypothetical protein